MTELPDDLYELAKVYVRRSTVRLLGLLDDDAPKVFIANEIGLLLKRGMFCFGEQVFADLARHFRDSFLEDHSRCAYCFASSENLIHGFCPKCAAKFDQEAGNKEKRPN